MVSVPRELRHEINHPIYRKVGSTYKEAQQNAPRLELEIRQSFKRDTPTDDLIARNRGITDIPVRDQDLKHENARDSDNEAELVVDQSMALNIAYQAPGATEQDLLEVSSVVAGKDTWQVWIEKRVVAEGTAMSTVGQWTSNLKKLAKFYGQDYLQGMTPLEAVAFREELLKTMKPASAKKVLSNIKGFWSWAKAVRQVTENIWEGTTRKLKDSPKKPLPPVEVVKAADEKASRNKDYAYSILRYTGCRSNEANGLRHCDIDLENRTINFVQWTNGDQVRRLKGKEKDERLIPISSALYEELKDLELDGSEKPIWPRQYKPKGQTWGLSWASDFKHKYHDHKPGFTSHDLRRWILTELTLANVSPFIIFEITRQTVPGASDVVQVYVRPTLEQLRVVMEKFDVLGNHTL